MAQAVQESYLAKPVVASGQIIGLNGGALGGFLATATGTVKLTVHDGAGATLLDTCPVTAGVFTPMPFSFPPGMDVYATLAGGAAGTFAIL